jgi:ribose transport system substrate-binding protein
MNSHGLEMWSPQSRSAAIEQRMEEVMTTCRLTRRHLVGTAVGGAAVTLLEPGDWPGRRVAAQERDSTIVLIPGEDGANFFYIPMACGAQAAAYELGVTLRVEIPEYWDATLQTDLLATVEATKPDAILIVPTDRTGLIAPIQDAIDAGIPVFTLDTAIDAVIALASIGSDNVEGGRIAARTLATAIGGTGKVFVVNVTPGISSTDEREKGFATELAQFPDITYLGQEYADNDEDTATAIVGANLRAVPDLAGIFATSLPMAYGAAVAVERATAAKRVKLVGFDASPDQVELFQSGTVTALIAQHPYEMGDVGVGMAAAYLETQQPPADKVVATGYSVVTPDNLADAEMAGRLYGLSCQEAPRAAPTSR